jgi:DNA-binding GntR family transcriptional regulator
VATDAIYHTLRTAILTGVLPPGERLGEVPLGALFGRSRTPVREAILRLESERLAERAARRGFIVARIAREEVLEVYAIRTVLDGLAARLAAHAILPGEIAHLHWLNDRMREAADRRDFRQLAALNIDFHEEVCRAGRNALLQQFVRQIHDWVRRFPDTTLGVSGRAASAVAEHAALIDALERRDPDEAERSAREHMARALQVRIGMLQDGDRRTASRYGGARR